MRTSAKTALIALIAALLLSTALSTASARNFSFNNQNIRVTWSQVEFSTSITTIRCRVTLEGSFHGRTIAKAPGRLIGAITRIDVHTNNCSGGTARPSANRPPPWHLVYEGFTGSLPAINTARIGIQRFQYDFIAIGRTCRYGNLNSSISGGVSLSGGEATNVVPVEGRNTGDLLEGPGAGELFGCPLTGSAIGNTNDGVVRLLNSTTRIRITLI